MKAFEPEPTTSPRELANWTFTRTLLVFVLAMQAAILAGDLFGPLGFAAGITIWIGAAWLAYQLLFAAFDAYLEARAEAPDAGSTA
jgi:hypothetical protein